MVDHVSDSFLETNVPLMMLIEAAESGNGREVEDCSNMFMGHAEKLLKVCCFGHGFFLVIVQATMHMKMITKLITRSS